MLHWLQSALPRRYVLFLQIFCLSFFLHILLMFVLSLLGYFSSKTLNLTLYSKTSPEQALYYMPLAKSIDNKKSVVNKKGSDNSRANFSKDNLKSPVLSKKAEKKPVIEKKSKKKISSSRIQIDPKLKKIASSFDNNFLKQKNPFIPDLSKIDTKDLIEKSKPLEKEEVEVKKNDETEQKQNHQAKANIAESHSSKGSENLVLGREDLEGLRIYENIQSEVGQYWKPPVGLSKDLEVVVRVSVDNFGKLKNITIQESSGVLAYDMSVRIALSKVEMPKEAFGKDLILTFKQ